jgi:hypothetical protein
MKEATLSSNLEPLLGLKKGSLNNWAETEKGQRNRSAGCLGIEIERALMKQRGKRMASNISVERVDSLLDELAAHSHFSANSRTSFTFRRRALLRADSERAMTVLRIYAHSPPRSQSCILRDLFLGLSPEQSAFMVQIIIQDLTPRMFKPLPESCDNYIDEYPSHISAILACFNLRNQVITRL